MSATEMSSAVPSTSSPSPTSASPSSSTTSKSTTASSRKRRSARLNKDHNEIAVETNPAAAASSLASVSSLPAAAAASSSSTSSLPSSQNGRSSKRRRMSRTDQHGDTNGSRDDLSNPDHDGVDEANANAHTCVNGASDNLIDSESESDPVSPLPPGPNLDDLPEEHITVTVKPERMTPRKAELEELNYLLSDSPLRRSFPRDCPPTDESNHDRTNRSSASYLDTPDRARTVVAVRQVKFATPPPATVSGDITQYRWTRPLRLANVGTNALLTPSASVTAQSSGTDINTAESLQPNSCGPLPVIVEESKTSQSPQEKSTPRAAKQLF